MNAAFKIDKHPQIVILFSMWGTKMFAENLHSFKALFDSPNKQEVQFLGQWTADGPTEGSAGSADSTSSSTESAL